MHTTHRRLRTTAAASSMAGLVVGLPVGSALASPAAIDPGGNNGTVKVENLDFDKIPDNAPHQPCTFRIEWFGFDLGATSKVTFTLHDPTDDGELAVVGKGVVDVGADRAGGGKDKDGSEIYTLSFTGPAHPKQGHHVRLDINTTWSKGSDRKSKVFWVGPCEAASPTATPTPTKSPTNTPTQSPTQPPTPAPRPTKATETPSPLPPGTPPPSPSAPPTTPPPSPSPVPSPGGGGGSATPTATPSPGTTTPPGESPSPGASVTSAPSPTSPTSAPSESGVPVPGGGGGSGTPNPAPTGPDDSDGSDNSDDSASPETATGGPMAGSGAGSGNQESTTKPSAGVPTSVRAGLAMVTHSYDSPTSPASLITGLLAIGLGGAILLLRRRIGRRPA